MSGYRRGAAASARVRILATVGLATVVGLTALGLTGCGRQVRPDDAAGQPAATAAGQTGSGLTGVDDATDVESEAQALVALGLESSDVPVATGAVDVVTDDSDAASPSPSDSATPGGKGQGKDAPGWRKRYRARVLLRKNTLHGEVVVQNRDGKTRTVVVQRGEVTAIDATTVTVKSTDGYTLTWTFGEKIRVFERRTSVQPEQIGVGEKVAVAGVKDGDRTVARLLIVPNNG